MKHIIVLIDISYSMKKNATSIIKGLNKFVENFKQSVDIYLSVMLFCDSRHYLCRAVPINTVKLFSTEELPPFGTTFLYDAVGAILTEWGHEKEAEHHFFIITDGCDTGSLIFTKNGVTNLCDEAHKSGWQVCQRLLEELMTWKDYLEIFLSKLVTIVFLVRNARVRNALFQRRMRLINRHWVRTHILKQRWCSSHIHWWKNRTTIIFKTVCHFNISKDI